MSTWIGTPDDRLSLRSAQALLADAARQAARPSWIWIVGLFFPSVLVVPAVGFRAVQSGASDSLAALMWLSFVPILLPPLVRMVVGLARLAEPRRWNEAVASRGAARLSDLWAQGLGITASTLGLWLCVLLLDLSILGLGLFVFWALGGDEHDWRAYLIGGPFLLFCCAYATVVSVLFQLSLQSLAQNQRGVVSALQHGWRLARNDGWATFRAALLDFGLSAVLGSLAALVGFEPFWCFSSVTSILYACLSGIVGVARALYWARIYRVLGGLAPEDGVPGLEAGTAPTEH